MDNRSSKLDTIKQQFLFINVLILSRKQNLKRKEESWTLWCNAKLDKM